MKWCQARRTRSSLTYRELVTFIRYGVENVLTASTSALKATATLKDLELGKIIHGTLINSRSEKSVRLSSSLINMYSKCGCLDIATDLFNAILAPDVVSWTALISGYAEHGQAFPALALFSRMQLEGCRPNERTFTSVIKACVNLVSQAEEVGEQVTRTALRKGISLHSQASASGFDCDLFVASSLVEMYAKSGRMPEASRVFNFMEIHDAVLWTVLMLGYVENGEEELGLELLTCMKSEGCAPNARTFAVAVKACASLAEKEECVLVQGKAVKLASLKKGMEVHAQVSVTGCGDTFLESSIIDMYMKCGCVLDARVVFDRAASWTVVSWNSLLLGYAENEEEELALLCFECMSLEGCQPDARSFVAAVKACGNLAYKEQGVKTDGKLVKVKSFEKGVAAYDRAVRNNLDTDLFVGSLLVDMFSRCGSLVYAWRVYDRMSNRDAVTGTALMLGYTIGGEESLALELLECMRSEGVVMDSGMFLAALKACIGLAEKDRRQQVVDGKLVKGESLEKVMVLHSEASKSSCGSSITVDNTLIDAYAKCGSMEAARGVFDRMQAHNVVSWTVLVLGYVENNESELALELFSCMNVEPDIQSFVAALKACSGAGMKPESLSKGVDIQYRIARSCSCLAETDPFIANSLIGMHARGGRLGDARALFESFTRRDLSSLWNAMLLGYVENGEGHEALNLFQRMMDEGSARPDAQTFVGALKSCSSLASLEAGRQVHGRACILGLETDELVTACLVDLYGKVGEMKSSRQVFDSVASRDLVTWNALLAGYSRQGDTKLVLEAFHGLVEESLQPDNVTLLFVLAACSHSGLVDKGRELFQAMGSMYGVRADIEHYHCMVDLLGRCNRLEEALEMVERMPFQASALTWRTLLGTCVKWNNVRVGKRAFDWLVRLDGDDPSAFNLMENLYKL